MNAKRISELLRELANEFDRADVNSEVPFVSSNHQLDNGGDHVAAPAAQADESIELAQLRNAAKQNMQLGKWSQRAVARWLGRTQTHVNLVLTGKRPSMRLLEQIALLPPRQNIPRNSPYRKAC
jgi:hypothetical protein